MFQNNKVAVDREKLRFTALLCPIRSQCCTNKDEPTGALDSNNAQNIMNILSRINSNFHTTILLVTHDPMSASYSNQVVFLKDGKIVNTIKRTGLTEIEFYNKIIEYSSKMQQVLN